MSITAEKIARELFASFKRRTGYDYGEFDALSGVAQGAYRTDARAILSLLQQGEPEYVKLERLGRTTEGNGLPEALRHIERLLEAPETEGKDQHGVHFKERRQYARAFVDAMLSASPLPPAPGAETGENESSIAPAREVNLKPGWLARDIESASRRIDEWEGRSSSRQAVLEDVLGIVEKHFVAEAAKGVSNTYGEYGATVIASLRNEIRALATTPPAEGERK